MSSLFIMYNKLFQITNIVCNVVYKISLYTSFAFLVADKTGLKTRNFWVKKVNNNQIKWIICFLKMLLKLFFNKITIIFLYLLIRSLCFENFPRDPQSSNWD